MIIKTVFNVMETPKWNAQYFYFVGFFLVLLLGKLKIILEIVS